MSGGIFVFQEGGGLVAMTEQACDAEAVLQKLIDDHHCRLRQEIRRWKPKHS